MREPPDSLTPMDPNDAKDPKDDKDPMDPKNIMGPMNAAASRPAPRPEPDGASGLNVMDAMSGLGAGDATAGAQGMTNAGAAGGPSRAEGEGLMSGLAAVIAHLQGLEAEPWRLDFFALLRRLEALAGEDAPRWGRALSPGAEAVRVGQEPSLAFAPAALSGIELSGARPVLRQRFFGYIGPNGPLPIHLSDFIGERALIHGDRTWLEFLDIFEHRFAMHLYRAWAQARPAVSMDRPRQDRFAAYVGAFIGIGGPERQQRDRVQDEARLYFSGRLARRVHNRETIEAILTTYFRVPVQLEMWVGHWMDVPSEELTRLKWGRVDGDRSANQRAGMGAMMGTRVWDRQHRVRLHIGPMSLERYEGFLPEGRDLPLLRDWVVQLLGPELLWDAQLTLERKEVPQTRLGAARGNAPRMGWKSWIGAEPRKDHAKEVRVDSDTRARTRGEPHAKHQER